MSELSRGVFKPWPHKGIDGSDRAYFPISTLTASTMFSDRFQPQSLKTRVTLFTLLIVVLCFWTLAFFTNRVLLRDEIERATGEQQRSALSLIVAEVTRGLQDRLKLLESEATLVNPPLLENPIALKAFLLERHLLMGMFNGGVMVWDPQGSMKTHVQFSQPELTATALLTPQELTALLVDGRSVIGSIRALGNAKVRAFAMTVPIRNAQGAIIGAMAGVVRLDQPNFLSQLTALSYGKTGNFFLIETGQRLIFATSDSARAMEVLPGPGVSPWIDRFAQGYEGTQRVVNPHGVDVLVSVRQIPVANWYASVTMSATEVFSLIDTLRSRIWPIALGLILLCGALIWLMLRRQLAPMQLAVNTLDGFVAKNQPPQALQVVRDDEIGYLLGGFNRLLHALVQQQKVLKTSELFKQAVLNSVTAEIAVLSHEGVILEINQAWRSHAALNNSGFGQGEQTLEVGSNYLQASQAIKMSSALREPEAMTAHAGICAVLGGQLPHFYLEYPCHLPEQQRWCSMSVTPLEVDARRGAVVSLEDITHRMEMEQQVRELAFYDPLTRLPNRRLALERLTQQMARARRSKSMLALLFIDLDKFKPINDELGHAVGDSLLQAVAQRILDCLRESDSAGRIGGDEFVVLLPDLQCAEAAMHVAEKIRSALAQEFVMPLGAVLNISASIGVALYPDHGETEKDLLRLGDEAMYNAKKSGRNAIHLCVPASSDPVQQGVTNTPPTYVHLRWKPAFNSGHPVIDQEHEALFFLANRLLDKVALRHQQPLEFEAAYAALFTHAEEHFAHEEAILQTHGYAQPASHAMQHQLLLARANALHLRLQVVGESADAEGELVKFLVAELVTGHLMHEDRAFFGLFKQQP